MMRVNAELLDRKLRKATGKSFVSRKLKWRSFLLIFFKKLGPKRFSKFVYNPSRGAFGGILLGWKDAVFDGVVGEINNFAITMEFMSRLSVEG